MGCSLIVKRNVNFRRINVSYKTIQCTGHAKSKINLAGPGLIAKANLNIANVMQTFESLILQTCSTEFYDIAHIWSLGMIN